MSDVHPHHLTVRQRLAAKDPARRAWLLGGAKPVPPAPVKPVQPGNDKPRCAYMGYDVLERAPGCNGGRRCTYGCEHPDESAVKQHPRCVPATSYKGCPHYSTTFDKTLVQLEVKQPEPLR